MTYLKFSCNFAYQGEHSIKDGFKAFYAEFDKSESLMKSYQKMVSGTFEISQSENEALVTFMLSQFTLLCKALNLEI